jgi:hypothetical protein
MSAPKLTKAERDLLEARMVGLEAEIRFIRERLSGVPRAGDMEPVRVARRAQPERREMSDADRADGQRTAREMGLPVRRAS